MRKRYLIPLTLVVGLPAVFVGCQWILAPHFAISLQANGVPVASLKVTVCGNVIKMDQDKYVPGLLAPGYSCRGRIRCEGEIAVDRISSTGAVMEHKICYVDGVSDVSVNVTAIPSKLTVACRLN